jgi:nucleoside 2-deoxyribosyltransferase
MPSVYLCGAINGCTDAECKDWRAEAAAALSSRFQIIDPMRRDYRGKEDESVREIVEGDYGDMDKSDVILVAADRPSWGTAMEVHQSFQAGKCVVTVCGQDRVSPWLRYHSTHLVRSMAEAFAIIKDLA